MKEIEREARVGDIFCFVEKKLTGQNLDVIAESMEKGDASFLRYPCCDQIIEYAEKMRTKALGVRLIHRHGIITEVQGKE